MPRRKARDSRITEVKGVGGEIVSYNALFQYKDEATGKWRQRPKRHKTVEEAERWLRDQDALAASGRMVAPSKEVLGTAIAGWLQRKLDAGKIGEATLANQQTVLASVYGPLFGVALCDLREAHFEAQYHRIKQQGKPGGSYTAYAHSLLSGYFGRLVTRGQLARNPLQNVERPAPDPKPKRAWDWDEIARFLAHQVRATMYPLWLLMFQKLLRVGECQALRWCDVEIDGPEGTGKVHITATVTRVRDTNTGKLVFVVGERAKTPDSTRTVMIEWQVQLALRKHRDRAMFAARVFGRAWDDAHFVFPDPNDETFLAQETIRYRLRAACEAADVRYLGNHGIRRTGISRRLGSDEPLFYVMADAGHVDTNTTKGYAVISESERRTWAKRFAVRVHGERGSEDTAEPASEAQTGD